MTYHYRLFGGVLASEVDFPELPDASPGSARWRLTVSDASPPRETLPRVGAEPVTQGVEVVLRAAGDVFRLEFDDTGVFRILDGGRRIVWHPPEDPSLEDVRTDVLGRVLAVALHAAGIPTLHGSGVVVGGVGLAFLAPKFHGKSTTTAALVRAGAALLGDDVLAVVPEPEPVVLPGVPCVRLRSDSAARFVRRRPARNVEEPADGRKRRVDWNGLGARAKERVPIGAVYLLRPVEVEAEVGVERERLPPTAAAVALVGQSKVGGLLGRVGAPALLDAAGRIASTVPVYALRVPRDLERVPMLVRRIAGWHGPLSEPATPPVGVR